jgi:hypothetical protein
MNMREQIVAVADRYAELSEIGRKRVSFILLNRGSKLDHIAGGADLNTATFERSMQWLSDHWPDGADWPDGIVRPAPQTIQEAAE